MATNNKFSNLSLRDNVAAARHQTPSNLPSHQQSLPHRAPSDLPTQSFFTHSSADRVNTDTVLVSSIHRAHPGLSLTTIPIEGCNLLSYAQSTGHASFDPIIVPNQPNTIPILWRSYIPPAQRIDGDQGGIANVLKFGKFSYTHHSHEYILYVAECRDGSEAYPMIINQYLVHASDDRSESAVDDMIKEIGVWTNTLHEEIWVFDSGYWQKSAELWRGIAKSRWEDVILDEQEKLSLRGDVKKFFDARERYEKYRIAWKRGIIYYGPPGNGKTISIKALSNELYHRDDSIPTLYVRSLASFLGPEYSVKEIFRQARAEAPCLLVFEDLDSLVTDQVRSYFLNEVDGINSNAGIYMIGSTNHIDRLDPGISKRPSRFDRKFEFPKPNEEQRTQYCEYWRHKLVDNKKSSGEQDDEADDLVHVDADEIDFPKELSPEIAKITDGFSFAYLQEAFVATLLTIAGSDHDEYSTACEGGKKDKFEHLLFWRVIKKQIELLKEQI